MPKKICSGSGCNKLIDKKEKRCSECESKRTTEKREYNRKYDYHNREEKIKRFYHSSSWKNVRRYVLIRDNYLCQHCLRENVITSAELVHHIVEVKEDFSKRLDPDNCISVCKPCHNKIDHKH